MPRKALKLDLETLEGLARIGATQADLAEVFGVSQPTISAKLSHEPYKSVWSRGKAESRMSIRRSLYKLAEAGNAQAVIHLSRCVLKMQEPPRESHVDADIRTTTRFVACWGRTPDELDSGAQDVIEGSCDDE